VLTRFLTALSLVLLFGMFLTPAQAQISLGGSSPAASNEITLPDPLTPETVRELVAHMSDDQVRDMLLDRLDAVAEAQAGPQQSKSLITKLTETWEAFLSTNMAAISKLPILFSKQAEAISNFVTSFGSKGLLSLFGFMAIAIAAGLVAEKVVGMLTRRWQGKIVAADDSSLWSALSFLFRRFLREMLGLIAFYFVIRLVGRPLLTDAQLMFAGPFVTYMIWMPRLTAAISRLIMAPNRSDLRLVNVNDRWASYLHRNIIGLMLLGGFSLFIIQFNQTNGVPMGETRIGYWLTMSVFV